MRPRNPGPRKNEEPTSLPVPRSSERPPGREMVIGFCLTALFFILVWSALTNFWHERTSPELQRGLTAVAENQVTEAQHFFESVLRERPDAPEVYLQILHQCQQYHQWNLMVQYAERGIRNCRYAPEPVRAALHANLSLGYLGQNHKMDALRQAKRALELNRDDPTFLNHYGYMLADLGKAEDLDDAEIYIKRALQKLNALPDTPEVQWEIAMVEDSLGWVYFKKGDYQEAVRILSQALEKAPDNAEGGDSLKEMYCHLGAAYQKIDRMGDALSMLDVALQIDPNFEPAKTRKAEVLRQNAAWCSSPKLLLGPNFDTYSLFLSSQTSSTFTERPKDTRP